MHVRVLACGSLATLLSIVPTITSGQDCPADKPFLLTMAVTPTVGKSPIWATWGKGALTWKAPDTAVGILIVRDRAVKGQTIVSGRHRASGAKVRFGKAGSTLGVREERLELDALGAKPRTATPKDLERYAFHMLDVWFPQPGCYEVTGRVGREQATFVINLQAPKK